MWIEAAEPGANASHMPLPAVTDLRAGEGSAQGGTKSCERPQAPGRGERPQAEGIDRKQRGKTAGREERPQAGRRQWGDCWWAPYHCGCSQSLESPRWVVQGASAQRDVRCLLPGTGKHKVLRALQ